jgi:hypothetical protein
MRQLSPQMTVAVMVFVAGALSAPWHANLSDTHVKIAVANRVLEGRGLSIDGAGFEGQYTVTGRGGHQYASYPILDCLMYLPTAGLSKLGIRCDPLPNLVMVAIVAWLLTILGLRAGVDLPAAVFGTLLAIFGTPVFAMACYGYDNLVANIGLAAILVVAIRPFKTWAWLLVGLVLGLCLLTREDAALMIVPAFIGALSQPQSRGRHRGRSLLELSVGGAPSVLITVVYRMYRFDVNTSRVHEAQAMFAPFLSRQHLLGIIGLTLSPGKGLLWYSLPLIFAIGVGAFVYRRWPAVLAIISSYAVAELLFHGSFIYWHGDWCWGPRYAAGVFLLVLPAGWWLYPRIHRPPGRSFATTVIVLAALLQAPALFLDPVNVMLGSVAGPLKGLGLLTATTIRQPPPPADQWVLYFAPSRSPVVLVWKEMAAQFRWIAVDWEVESALLRALIAPLLVGLCIRRIERAQRNLST